MESSFLVALLSIALLFAVMRLVHEVRLKKSLKRLLRHLVTLWRKRHVSDLSPSVHDAADDCRLR